MISLLARASTSGRILAAVNVSEAQDGSSCSCFARSPWRGRCLHICVLDSRQALTRFAVDGAARYMAGAVSDGRLLIFDLDAALRHKALVADSRKRAPVFSYVARKSDFFRHKWFLFPHNPLLSLAQTCI